MTHGFLSVLPPVLAVALAIGTRQVYISLFVSIWLGWTILQGWHPFLGLAQALETCVRVFESPDNTRVIVFSAVIGAVLAFVQRSGGVDGFVEWISNKRWWQSRRNAALLTWLIGVLIFVESSITILVGGAIARPIFDKLRISREKLAYILDSTSAPICVLIPFNAWGALVVGLLSAQGIDDPIGVFARSVPYNFYCFSAVLMVPLLIVWGRDFGPMRRAEKRIRQEGRLHRQGAKPLFEATVGGLGKKPGIEARAFNLLVPMGTMVLMMPVGLLITGKGDLTRGSGSTSVLWAVLAALAVGAILYRAQKIFSVSEMLDLFFKGLGSLMPVALLLVLAFAVGATCRELETGPYVASWARAFVSPSMLPAVLFVCSGFIAFSTGTSFGTFAIMIPIAVPMASALEANTGAAIAAVLGGGVFGDHASPISDTTVISSMAAATDHIDHVRTQLPYALVAALLAVILYMVIGAF